MVLILICCCNLTVLVLQILLTLLFLFTVCEGVWSDIVCIEFTSIIETGLYLQEAGSNF